MKVELTIINRGFKMNFLSLLDFPTSLIAGALQFKLNSNMRILFFIFLFCLSSPAWSQPWQDALKNAREAYVSKSYDASVSHYRKAQQLAPKNIDLSIELAQSLYRAGKYEEAEKLYQNQLNQQQGKITQSDISRQIGNARMHQQKYADAIDAYKNSLRYNPSDVAARHNLTKAIQKRKEEQEQNKKSQNQNPPPAANDPDPKPKEEEPKQDPQEEKQSPQQTLPQKNPNDPKSVLNDKRADRLLEELSEKEKETKRRMNSNVGDRSTSKPGVKKDW